MYSEDSELTYEEKYDDSNYEANPPHLDGVPEMSSLIYLEAPNVLHNLECRYKKGEIYTSISKVLIAVNPYAGLDIYGPDVIRKYREAAQDIKRRLRSDLPPHVFTVAQTSYFNLLKIRTNQSMIVCGESGSGKTESAKHLMRYLAANSKGDESLDGRPSIENQVLDANPILESFGNAKTVLNNNSSRFGKFTKIVFQEDLVKIAGSFIETYLLEKSRVTKQDNGERNYHIFYMLCRGKAQLSYGEELALGEPEQFNYLNQSGTTTADGIDDEEKMRELTRAFHTLAISPDDTKNLFRATAGVLHLGNIKLIPDAKDNAFPSPESQNHIDAVAQLYGIKKEPLIERLSTRKIKIGKEVVAKQLSVSEGVTNREALAKALYHGVFLWIVSRINTELYLPQSRDPNLKWIGILDVFGFESFEHNSFEQFCINFANERLQQFFNGYILLSEQEEYLAEAIQWVPLKVPNNQDVIDLIDKKPTGILSVLDSECIAPKATSETFIQNLFKVHKFHKRMQQVRRVRKAGVQAFSAINGFSIVHYAGKVIYNAEDFLVKNNDAPTPENVALLSASSNLLARQLMKDGEEDEKGKPKGAQLKSTGGFFSKQLESLMNNLLPTTPYFVRCIKPNPLKKPAIFDWRYVRPQLECGGIIEALRILKCGYPTRCTYDDIFDRYGHILNPTPPKLNKRDFCEAVLRCCGSGLDRSEFQLGLSKCFFRPGKQEFLEELLHGPELSQPTILNIKRFLLNKRFQRARGVITAHISFSFVVRKMRAEAKVKRLFQMASVITGTFVTSLSEQRQNIAAVRLQAAAHAIIEHKQVVEKKKSICLVTKFYQHNVMRRKLQAEVDKKIAAKVALLSEREKQRKEQVEREKREARKREAEAKEQARLDAIRKKQEDEEAKVREEAEKVKREQEERERKAREIEEKERELKDRAARALASMAEVEALKETLLTREKEMMLRAEEFAKKEKRFALAAEHESSGEGRVGVDALAQLIQTGEVFDCGAHTPESTPLGLPKIFLQVNPMGELCWYNPEQKPPKGEEKDWDNLPSRERSLTEIEQSRTQIGQIALLKVQKILLPSGLSGEEEKGFYFLIYGQEGEKVVCLDLETKDASVRNKWCTALRYAVRNMTALGTVSRPLSDQTRGNWPCAELKDEVNDLTEQNGKLLQTVSSLQFLSQEKRKPPPAPPTTEKDLKEFIEKQLKSHTGAMETLQAANEELKQKAKELQDELTIANEGKARLEEELERKKGEPGNEEKKGPTTPKPVVIHTNEVKPPPPGGSIISQLQQQKKGPPPTPTPNEKELLRQITQLTQKNKTLEDELAQQTGKAPVKVIRQPRISASAPTFADKMKMEELEGQNLKLQRQNAALEEKVNELEAILTAAKLRSPAKPLADEEEAKIIQKAQAAKKAVTVAESRVQEAEEKVRKRQEIIRHAMRVVAEREKELQTTTATMEVLGINADNMGEELVDETARKLASLKAEQKAKQAAAKHILVSNYEAMVREAEALNAMNEDLSQKNAQKAENEQLQEDLIQKLGKPTRPPIAGPAARGGKPQADDGCVVS